MATPETFRALLAANAVPGQSRQTDYSVRTKHLGGKVNEFLYKTAHEPSLAGHRIQEHVYKTVPALAKEWSAISSTTSKMDGVLFDLDYTSKFLNQLDESIQNSSETREVISELASKISAATSRLAGQTNR